MIDDEKPGHTQNTVGSSEHGEGYDAKVERKYLRRRIPRAVLAAGAAAALGAGFSLSSSLSSQNADLSAPPPLPRKVRPTPTPIPPPDPVPTPSQRQALALKATRARADAWAKKMEASPQPSLAVFEPSVMGGAASGTAESAQDFGDGCARWLYFQAAGEPEVGGAPMWHRIEYARLSIADARGLSAGERAAFRPVAHDLDALYRATGASRIAIGRLQGGGSDASPATLSYEVWDAATNRRVAAFKRAGTREAIAQQLPRLARELQRSASTWVGQSEIPQRCELTAKELEIVGEAPWSTQHVGSHEEKATAQQVAALERLAPRSSLAALEMLHDYPFTVGDARYNAARGHLLRLAPGNALAWAGAFAVQEITQPDVVEKLEELGRKHPRNAALCAAQAQHAQVAGHIEEACQWSSKALALSPRDPSYWRTLADFVGTRAADLRQSRYSGEISAAEWAKLNRLYETKVLSSARAVSLDDHDGQAWAELYEGATFASEEDVAFAALWRGLAADPENTSLCSWALEMLQPKWSSRTDLLPVIISHIERTRPLFDKMHGRAIQSLSNAGEGQGELQNQANEMLNRTRIRLEDEARLEPKNPAPHYALAHFAKRFGLENTQLETCLREFRAYLELCPWDADAHYCLGWMLHHKKQDLPAAKLSYQAALRIKPDFPDARNGLDEIRRTKPPQSQRPST